MYNTNIMLNALAIKPEMIIISKLLKNHNDNNIFYYYMLPYDIKYIIQCLKFKHKIHRYL